MKTKKCKPDYFAAEQFTFYMILAALAVMPVGLCIWSLTQVI